ncbi:MAG: (Fe-S)-binding protein [Eubacteriales bacterium]|nr:(Fe-S)-binding protein [Eubacteriales bacterium]
MSQATKQTKRMDDLNPEKCIGCGKCTKSCSFLEKYDMDLRDFSEKPELSYGCFLCGRCTEVCPVSIDGKEIALRMRTAQCEENGGTLTERGFQGLLWEKDPYRFANYRRGRSASVLWTGCNFTGFFQKTEKQLIKRLSGYGIGVIYDCCGKPVEELGLIQDAERNLTEIGKKLLDAGVRELIMVCPNCYYYMRGRLPAEIRLTTIYRKLDELGIGDRITLSCDGNESMEFPLYRPCPDRTEELFLSDLAPFLPKEAELETFSGLQCCGLGGCAAAKEPELAEGMSGKALSLGGGKLYTYCASCISQFRRKGIEGAQHVLPLILGIEEPFPGGIRPFLNKAIKKII